MAEFYETKEQKDPVETDIEKLRNMRMDIKNLIIMYLN